MFEAYKRGAVTGMEYPADYRLSAYRRGAMTGFEAIEHGTTFPLPTFQPDLNFTKVYTDMLKWYSHNRGYDPVHALNLEPGEIRQWGLQESEHIPHTTFADVQIIYAFWYSAIRSLGDEVSLAPLPANPESRIKQWVAEGKLTSNDQIFPDNPEFWGRLDNAQLHMARVQFKKRMIEPSYWNEFKNMFARRMGQIWEYSLAHQLHKGAKKVSKTAKDFWDKFKWLIYAMFGLGGMFLLYMFLNRPGPVRA